MKIFEIEKYVKTLNSLYEKTGLLVQCETEIYEVTEECEENKVVAILKWNNEECRYYVEYVK